MKTLEPASINLEHVFVDHIALRQARFRRGLRIVDVARIVGKKSQHISNYENGSALPPADILARLCILYECDLSQLTKKI